MESGKPQKRLISKEELARMKLVRRYSKATLVQYIAMAQSGFPFSINYDLLRALQANNDFKDLQRLLPEAMRLKNWLLKRHAITQSGNTLIYAGYGSRNTKKIRSAWNRYVRLAKKIRTLQIAVFQ